MIATIPLTLVVAMLLACLAYREAANQSIVRDLLAQTTIERAEHRAHVEMLLQRLMAPELAAIQYATPDTDPENTYPLDDSEQAERQDYKVAADTVLAQIREHEQAMA